MNVVAEGWNAVSREHCCWPPLGMSCGHPYPMTGPSGGPTRPGHMVPTPEHPAGPG